MSIKKHTFFGHRLVIDFRYQSINCYRLPLIAIDFYRLPISLIDQAGLLKVNIIIWISENQELQRNPMKSSDSRTNSKYKSPYECRTNSHCVKKNKKTNAFCKLLKLTTYSKLFTWLNACLNELHLYGVCAPE